MDSKAAAQLLGQLAKDAASVGKTAEFVSGMVMIQVVNCVLGGFD
jgi:hypothetical protein